MNALASPSWGYFLGKQARETDVFAHGGFVGGGGHGGLETSQWFSTALFYFSVLFARVKEGESAQISPGISAGASVARQSVEQRLLRAITTARAWMQTRGYSVLTNHSPPFDYRSKTDAVARAACALKSGGDKERGIRHARVLGSRPNPRLWQSRRG